MANTKSKFSNDDAPQAIQELYSIISSYICSLGKEISENRLQEYIAFKKTINGAKKNIAAVRLLQKKIQLNLLLNPDEVDCVKGFICDILKKGYERGTGYTQEKGHKRGTGYTQIIIKNNEDFEKSKALINEAYNKN